MESDLRGKQGKHNAVEEERENKVIEHIQQFLTVESHYVRKDVKYQYFPEELTVKEMHRMYKKWCDNKGYNQEML